MRYRLRSTQAAKLDVREALQYSAFRFGLDAKQRYADLIAQVLEDIQLDPHDIKAHERFDLGDGIVSRPLRSASHDRGVGDPRHIVFYVVTGDQIEVIRVLHEARDFLRHL